MSSSGSSASHGRRGLHLWSGAHKLKKQQGPCEDAYFANSNALGVADGVGCMVQFSSYGINAAAYAADLMKYASAALQPGGAASAGEEKRPVAERAKAALGAAER